MIAELDCHYFHLLLCFCFLPVDCVDFQLLILLTVNVSTVALAFVRFSPSLLLLLPPNLFNTCFVCRVFVAFLVALILITSAFYMLKFATACCLLILMVFNCKFTLVFSPATVNFDKSFTCF